MRVKFISLFICMFVSGVFTWWASPFTVAASQSNATVSVESQLGIDSEASATIESIIKHQSEFFEIQNFNDAIYNVNKNITDKKHIKKGQAIIVPHHLLVSPLIAEMFLYAKTDNVNKVILIGPNHKDLGTKAIASTLASWEIQGSLIPVLPQTDSILSLEKNINISLNDNVFKKEHSIGAIIPFINYYIPKAEIIPIAISSYIRLNEVNKLANWLSEEMDEQTLIIFSIDFSHYLTQEEASYKDIAMTRYIEEFNISKIIELNNDYLDSPGSLAIALRFAQIQKTQPNIIFNLNSANFLIRKPLETTSYFGIVFN